MRHGIDYSNFIRLTPGDDALYLSIILPFRVGHPTLCIPWTDIESGKTTHKLERFVVLTLGNKERIPLRLTERIAGRLGVLEGMPNTAARD